MEPPASPVIVVPENTPDETIDSLTDAGYIPIRTDNPAAVVIIAPECRVSGGDMLMAAMRGMQSPVPEKGFFNEFHRRMIAREKNEKP